MTPEEKAQELVDKFGNTETDITFVNSDSDTELASGYLTRNAAKQSALIAVEEIIKACPIELVGNAGKFKYTEDYWNSVKTEIDAL